MVLSIRRILGFEKLHPEVQFYLDSSNFNIAQYGSLLIMILETAAFINTFFYKFNENQNPFRWLLYHRILYAFLFLVAAQLFIYVVYHKLKRISFSRFVLDASLVFFFISMLFFGIAISINDYLQHEQILVFLTLELFVTGLFMIKPYLGIILVVIPFGIFYFLMKTTLGVSTATNINYPIIMILFLMVVIVRYQQYLKIAKNNIVNHTLAEQLRMSSLYDFLTKLKNRNALYMDFEDTDANLNINYIVMLTDIDDFKSFNDQNGHAFGDKLLKNFAAILQTNFGKEHCYRYGGDEYLIIVPEVDEQVFLKKIDDCEAAINDKFHFSGGYVKGFVTSAKVLHNFINKADEKLYEAKNAGKNKVLGSFEA